MWGAKAEVAPVGLTAPERGIAPQCSDKVPLALKVPLSHRAALEQSANALRHMEIWYFTHLSCHVQEN